MFRCIPNKWKCDGDEDCLGGEDESHSICDVPRWSSGQIWKPSRTHKLLAILGNYKKAQFIILVFRTCDPSQFTCAQGGACVPRWCQVFAYFQCLVLMKSTNTSITRLSFWFTIFFCYSRDQQTTASRSWLCDTHPDCEDGSDEVESGWCSSIDDFIQLSQSQLWKYWIFALSM